MASSHGSRREVPLKVVYYGPGQAGKSTSLTYLHGTLRPDARGQLISVTTGADRTLFFDFMPPPVPRLGGKALRLQLYTTPGEVRSESTHRGLLEGVDAVVFVADSGRNREADNVLSLERLRDGLGLLGLKLSQVPHVFVWNKRDLPDALPEEELAALLNPGRVPAFGTVAVTGIGVFETLREITTLLIAELTRRRSRPSSWPGTSHSVTPPGSTPGIPPSPRRPLTPDVFSLSGLMAVPPLPREDHPQEGDGPPEPPSELPEEVSEELIIETLGDRDRDRDTEGALPSPWDRRVAPSARAQDAYSASTQSLTSFGGDLRQVSQRALPGQSSLWLLPLTPEEAKGASRQIALSSLLPPGPFRDQLAEIEADVKEGLHAQAVRRAFAYYGKLSAAGKGGRVTQPRLLRLQKAAKQAEAGISSPEDALFALFLLLDALIPG